MSNIGKNLEPAKFGVAKQNPDTVSPVTEPDRFGQVYDNQKDSSAGNVPSAMQVNQNHTRSDVDSSPKSQHHTLGTRRNQASPGNHIHDGITSPKLGAMSVGTSGNTPVPTLVLTGSKGGNVALTNLINMLKTVINFTDNTT